MIELKDHLGPILRALREASHQTLRDVAENSTIALGYLSEIERGMKEPSSQIIALICVSLNVEQSTLFREVADRMEAAELYQREAAAIRWEAAKKKVAIAARVG